MDEETREKTLQKSRQDRFAELLGIELVDIKPGYGLVSMAVGDSMLNFHGLLHGGAVFSLADVALGAAAISRGRMSVGLSVDITYLRTVVSGTRLIAEATEEYLGERTALYHITVTTDGGDLVASCHGVVYRKRERFLEN